MDDIYGCLSDEQIDAYLIQFKNVPSIVTTLNGIKEIREANREKAMEILQAQALAEQAKLTNITYLEACANATKNGKPKLLHIAGHDHYQVLWREVKTPQAIPEGTSEARVAELIANPDREWKWIVSEHFVTKLDSAGKPITKGKRLVKKVYRKGTEPLELVLDGSKVEPPLTTWTGCGRYLNENPHLLNKNPDGSPFRFIETTASGLVDLKTAGFIGIES